MKKSFPSSFPVLLVLAAAAAVAGACSRDVAAARAADPSHGRYLVERVGMCIDCHSPRDEKGKFVTERWLQGGPLPFAPSVPMPWAAAAPTIGGLPSLTDAQAQHFLVTGELPGGRRPRPPMPEFRFSPDDARDVVAYLRKPQAPSGN